LPEEAQWKHKRSQLERTVYLFPIMLNYILKDFFEASKPPIESGWNKVLENGLKMQSSILMNSPLKLRGRLLRARW